MIKKYNRMEAVHGVSRVSTTSACLVQQHLNHLAGMTQGLGCQTQKEQESHGVSLLECCLDCQLHILWVSATSTVAKTTCSAMRISVSCYKCNCNGICKMAPQTPLGATAELADEYYGGACTAVPGDYCASQAICNGVTWLSLYRGRIARCRRDWGSKARACWSGPATPWTGETAITDTCRLLQTVLRCHCCLRLCCARLH